MNVYEADRIVVPEGSVKRILDLDNNVIWEKKPIEYYTPFFIKDLSGSDNTISISKTHSEDPSITVEKSLDGINWTVMGTTDTTPITATIPADGVVYLRSTANKWCRLKSPVYTDGQDNHINVSGAFSVGGNIMSLLQGASFHGGSVLTNLNECAFAYIFYQESNLMDASELLLPTKLATACFRYMFAYCTSLTTAPKLPATTLVEHCYQGMFYRCISLTSAPSLQAKILSRGCYSNMFYGCSNLITAPNLPATTLAEYCYSSMFYGCSNLITAPNLPATSLATYCYFHMFNRCSSLTKAPELHAETLVAYCYNTMFERCSSLNEIKCYANDISAEQCINGWVRDVAASGTFYKDTDAIYPSGVSGIPEGWTIVVL